jgi:hypothetical protein
MNPDIAEKYLMFEVENQLSQVAHGRLGYEEATRLVHFRKAL